MVRELSRHMFRTNHWYKYAMEVVTGSKTGVIRVPPALVFLELWDGGQAGTVKRTEKQEKIGLSTLCFWWEWGE